MSDAALRPDPPEWFAENVVEFTPPHCSQSYVRHALPCPDCGYRLLRNSKDHTLFHCTGCGTRFCPPEQGGTDDE